jgi:hypothetical protein
MDKPKFIRRPFPSLEQMHQDWEINCMPSGAPKMQSVEMKKAFMWGVASLFHVLKYEIPEISDEEGCAYVDRLEAQLTQFFTKDVFKL